MYIDPSAGSMVLQVVAAAAISGLAMMSRVRHHVRMFLSSIFRRRGH